MFQIFEGIEADLMPPRGLTQAIVQRNVQAQFGIGKRRHKYRHSFFIGRFQDAALSVECLARCAPIAWLSL